MLWRYIKHSTKKRLQQQIQMKVRSISLASVALTMPFFAVAVPVYADVAAVEYTTSSAFGSLTNAPSISFSLEDNGEVLVNLNSGAGLPFTAFAFEGPQLFALTDTPSGASISSFDTPYGSFNNGFSADPAFQSAAFEVGAPGEFTSVTQLIHDPGTGHEVFAISGGVSYTGYLALAPVPLPPAALLMLCGLSGFGVFLRKRQAA